MNLWTFVSECDVPSDVSALLVSGETAIAAYQTIRDVAIFTNKRLIIRDAQGLTGSKIEVYSIPYDSILFWSSENAGGFIDFNAELTLMTKVGPIKVKVRKGIDIRRLDLLIANAVL